MLPHLNYILCVSCIWLIYAHGFVEASIIVCCLLLSILILYAYTQSNWYWNLILILQVIFPVLFYTLCWSFDCQCWLVHLFFLPAVLLVTATLFTCITVLSFELFGRKVALTLALVCAIYPVMKTLTLFSLSNETGIPIAQLYFDDELGDAPILVALNRKNISTCWG